MWRPKWGNLFIKPNIGAVDDDIESRGFGQPHILCPLRRLSSWNLKKMVEFEEGNMKNIVNRKCWRKYQPEGDWVDLLDDTKGA